MDKELSNTTVKENKQTPLKQSNDKMGKRYEKIFYQTR